MRLASGRRNEQVIPIAIDEARQILREGNSGFGAVVVHGNDVVARAHDGDDHDPTAHAELLAIRDAARRIGPDLSGCGLVSTAEPCPVCATAIVWAGIRRLAFGCSIPDAMAEGRRRIPLRAAELFARAGHDVVVEEGVLRDACTILYRRDVRAEIRRLRGAGPADLVAFGEALAERRRAWVRANRRSFGSAEPRRLTAGPDPLAAGRALLLAKLELDADEVPIIARSPTCLVFASRNFCPTLEACRILGLDTREVCRLSTEAPMLALLREFDPRLRFTRSYERIRPYAEACEESIELVV